MGIRLGPVIFNLRQQLLWQRVMVVFLTAHGGVSDTDVTLPVAAGWVLFLLAIMPLQLNVAVPGVPLSGLHVLAPEVVVWIYLVYKLLNLCKLHLHQCFASVQVLHWILPICMLFHVPYSFCDWCRSRPHICCFSALMIKYLLYRPPQGSLLHHLVISN